MKTKTIFFISTLVIVLTFASIASTFGIEAVGENTKEFLATEIGTGLVLFLVYLWLSHNYHFIKKKSRIYSMNKKQSTTVPEKDSGESRAA